MRQHTAMLSLFRFNECNLLAMSLSNWDEHLCIVLGMQPLGIQPRPQFELYIFFLYDNQSLLKHELLLVNLLNDRLHHKYRFPFLLQIIVVRLPNPASRSHTAIPIISHLCMKQGI